MRRLFGILSAFALLVGTAAPVAADVEPAVVNEALEPGDSFIVDKTVDVPAVPPKLDLCLIIDLSGSYADDLATIQEDNLAQAIVDGVRAEVADSQFGLGTFVDFPFSPWGSATAGDYAWLLNQAMTANEGDWVAAVNTLETFFGGDEPESQYEALFQAVTGEGRDVPPGGGSLGDVAAGQDCQFREDASKVIAITTDASFHVPTPDNTDDDCTSPSPPCPFDYPGPTRDATVDALNAQDIAVIAIKAPGSGEEMDDIASATGGAVVTTASDSSDIVAAILTGLEEISRDITGNPVGCDPLVVMFDPTVHEDIVGGEGVKVVFTETITVPEGTDPAEYTCTVDFLADDAVIGTQNVTIAVNEDVEECQEGETCTATASNDEATATLSCPEDGCDTVAMTVDDEPQNVCGTTGDTSCEVSGLVYAKADEDADKDNTFILMALDTDPGVLGAPSKVQFFFDEEQLDKCGPDPDIVDTPCVLRSAGAPGGGNHLDILFRLRDLDTDPTWGAR